MRVHPGGVIAWAVTAVAVIRWRSSIRARGDVYVTWRYMDKAVLSSVLTKPCTYLAEAANEPFEFTCMQLPALFL